MASDIIEITAQEFRAYYPEFKNPPYTDEVIIRFINLAYCYVSNLNCGCFKPDCRKQALMLMIAHLLTIWTYIQGESGNPLQGGVSASVGLSQKAKVGEVQVELAMPTIQSMYQSWLNSTEYGKMLYALLMAHIPTVRYVGGTPNRFFWTK